MEQQEKHGSAQIDGEGVELIREVFRYARRFISKRFVFQISSAIVESDAFPSLVRDLAILQHAGIQVILVPGAGVRIDALLNQFSIPIEKSGGMRVTTEESLPLIKMAAFDNANRLMTELSSQQVSSVIGNWVRARSRGVVDGVDFQMTGSVEKVSISQIERILADGIVPILPCIGWNAMGRAYNVSSNELAAQLAAGLGAVKLFFIAADFELSAADYRLDIDNPVVDQGRLSRFSIKDARTFADINAEILDEDVRDIILRATDAASSGVERVHILDGRQDGVVLQEIFSTKGSGTLIHVDPFESIRAMAGEDVGDVLRLMGPGMAAGNLIQRSREDLQIALRQFSVFETDGSVRGCGAVFPYPDGSAEIAGMAVDPNYSHLGIGNKILRYLIEQGRRQGLKSLFALTTQASDWFQNMGFTQGEVADLPEEKRSIYNADRNSRIFLLKL